MFYILIGFAVKPTTTNYWHLTREMLCSCWFTYAIVSEGKKERMVVSVTGVGVCTGYGSAMRAGVDSTGRDLFEMTSC